MRLGISSYTYTWAVGVGGYGNNNPMTAFDLIEKAFDHGLNVVQIADNLPLENLSDSELKKIRTFSASRNISIEMGGRGLTPEHTIRCLDTAEKLGSPILRMVADGKDFEPTIESLIEIVKRLEPEFRRRGIRLAIENHDRFKAREFESLILSAGSEWIGICLDSVNSMGAGEGFELVSDILLPYTINLHIKDFTIFRAEHKMGLIIEGRPAGKGMLKIPDLVSKINAKEKCQSAILELWTPPEKDIETTIRKESQWAEESLEYLIGIL